VWVILAAHAAIGLGTLSGGWRIHTMGTKITKLQPVGGFAAETARRGDAVFRQLVRHSGLDHAHHHWRHRRGRRHAQTLRGALGRCRTHRLGIGLDDPHGGADRGVHVLGGEDVWRVVVPNGLKRSEATPPSSAAGPAASRAAEGGTLSIQPAGTSRSIAVRRIRVHLRGAIVARYD